MTSSTKIKAMLYLIEDPDPQTYHQIKPRVIDLGTPIIPTLLRITDQTTSGLVETRIEDIIKQIRFEKLQQQLKEWVQSGSQELDKGVFLFCTYQYPNINLTLLEEQVTSIGYEANYAIESLECPQKIIKTLNRIFFDTYGFRILNHVGVIHPYFYPSHVLRARKGEAIALGIIYLLLSRCLNLPISMLRLPENKFILAYYLPNTTPNAFNPTANVLFYIDMHTNGYLMQQPEVLYHFFNTVNMSASEAYLSPLENRGIVALLIQNLLEFYDSTEEVQKVDELEILLDIVLRG